MMKREAMLAAILAGVGVGAGCSQVDPRGDYRRAAERIAEATGEIAIYQPHDEAAAEAVLSDLLAGGITTDAAVRIALVNNPTLQAAFFRIGMSRADVVQSGLLSNPSLGVSLRLPEAGGRANLEAGLAQNIADLWQIPVRKRAAQRELDRAILEVAASAADLAVEVKAAYLAAAAADQLLAIARENLRITQELHGIAIARQQAGSASAIDVNLARGTMLAAEVVVQNARLDSSVARRRLATLLGLTLDANELDLNDPLPAPPRMDLDAAAITQMAREFRLDLRAAREAVDAARARVELEVRRIFPDVNVGLALERSERRALQGRNILADTARASIAAGGLAAPEIQSRGQRDAERRAVIDTIVGPTFDLTLPIFDQNQAQIAKAKYAHEQALRTLIALDRQAVQQARDAADRAVTAWGVARLFDDEILPQAQRTLDLSFETYRVGRSPITVILEAQRTHLDARRTRVIAHQSAATAIAELQRAVARPDVVVLGRAGVSTQPASTAPATRPAASDEMRANGESP